MHRQRAERMAVREGTAEAEEGTAERRLDRVMRRRLYRRTAQVRRTLRIGAAREERTVSLEAGGRLGTEGRTARKEEEEAAAADGETTRGRSRRVRECYARVVRLR